MTKSLNIILDIGDMPIVLHTDDPDFARMVEHRYGPFVNPSAGPAAMELDVKLLPSPDGWRWDDGLEEGGGEGGDGANQAGGAAEGLDGLDDQSASIAADDAAAALLDPDDDVQVSLNGGLWTMQRGDFHAEWDPSTRRGWVQQTVNPYSIDGVLRILHSLVLAREGGLLIHGASAVRNGRAFIFAGISGTGKTTISRLAPGDVKLLTDEISYVRDSGLGARGLDGNSVNGGWQAGAGAGETGQGAGQTVDGRRETGEEAADSGVRGSGARSNVPNSESRIPSRQSPIPNSQPLTPNPQSVTPSPGFIAYGTPFAGELAKIGEKVKAPLGGLFLLKQGPENRIEELTEKQVVAELMRHILFFAHDSELVNRVFETVCGLVRRVPVRRLIFKKDRSVWDLIG